MAMRRRPYCSLHSRTASYSTVSTLTLTTGVVDCKKFGDAALGPYHSLSHRSSPNKLLNTAWSSLALSWAASEYTIGPLLRTHFRHTSLRRTKTEQQLLPSHGTDSLLVTGCARGTTKVFDALTLEHIRSFPSPVPRRRTAPAFAGGPLPEDPAVRQILLGAERDVLFVAVGDHVMAWRAGPVAKGWVSLTCEKLCWEKTRERRSELEGVSTHRDASSNCRSRNISWKTKAATRRESIAANVSTARAARFAGSG
ncbi:hypothetical protein C8F01DRAFT_224105 [Mycena amicta]|nr:hypothetical protein C8F01DRAFT_224105 [Mycena amicta]